MNNKLLKRCYELVINYITMLAEQEGIMRETYMSRIRAESYRDGFQDAVKELQPAIDALKFYAEVFPMPMEVVAKNKDDERFADLSEQLLNKFHTVAREALKQIGEVND